MRTRRGTVVDTAGDTPDPIDIVALNKKWAMEHPSPEQVTPTKEPTTEFHFKVPATPITRNISKKLRFDTPMNEVTPEKSQRASMGFVRQSPRHRQLTPILKKSTKTVEKTVENKSSIDTTAIRRSKRQSRRPDFFDPGSPDVFSKGPNHVHFADKKDHHSKKGGSKKSSVAALKCKPRTDPDTKASSPRGAGQCQEGKFSNISTVQLMLIIFLLMIGYTVYGIDTHSSLRQLDSMIDSSGTVTERINSNFWAVLDFIKKLIPFRIVLREN